MKKRLDFVTNSSSSSFIIARKKELTEKEKEKILDFVLKNFFYPQEVISTQEELDEYARENWYYKGQLDSYYKEKYQKFKEAIDDGKVISHGHISREEADYDLMNLYQKIWEETDVDIISFDS